MFVVPTKFWKYALSLQGTRVPLSIFIAWLSKFHRELTIGSKATHILLLLLLFFKWNIEMLGNFEIKFLSEYESYLQG